MYALQTQLRGIYSRLREDVFSPSQTRIAHSDTTAPKMPTIGASAVSFEHVSREWRCKYSMDAEGGPAGSASLKACEALLQEYLPKLKALPAMEVRRVVCGGCGDFKVVLTQPCAEHDAWKASEYTVEGTQHPLPSLSALCLSLTSCSVAHCSQASSWRSSRLSVRRT